MKRKQIGKEMAVFALIINLVVYGDCGLLDACFPAMMHRDNSFMDIEKQTNESQQFRRAQLAQGNCEFLTVVRRAIPSNQQLPALFQYAASSPSTSIQLDGFIQIFIEIAYLIYSCRHHSLNIKMHQTDFRVEQCFLDCHEARFRIIILYRFDLDARPSSYSQIVQQLYQYLFQFRQKFKGRFAVKSRCDVKLQEEIGKFVEQYHKIKELANNLDFHARQQEFFACLQCTDLFQQQSLLFKIKQISMLDLVQPRISQFIEYRERDASETLGYNNIRKKVIKNKEEERKAGKRIQDNIVNFFFAICQDRPSSYKIDVEYIPESLKEEPESLNMTIRVHKAVEDTFSKKLSAINAKIWGQAQTREEVKSSKNQFMEYHIHYSPSNNRISVMLFLSSMQIGHETADILLFQSNSVAYEIGNVSIGSIRPNNNVGKNSDTSLYIAFKAESVVDRTESVEKTLSPLQKILMLMDLTMVSTKVYEPYVNPSERLQMVLDFQKCAMIAQKVRHYSDILLRCAKRVYHNI